MNISEALPRHAQRSPHKLAIVDRRRSLTFLDFHRRVNRLPRYLRQQGLGKGDPVALSCGSPAEHFEALFALGKIGALAVPFDFNWSAVECAAMVGFFEPKAFILEGRAETKSLFDLAQERVAAGKLLAIEGAENLAGASYEEALERSNADDFDVEVQGSDPFLLMITSGTTGFPKACSIDHQTYALRCLNYGMTKGMNQDERALMTLPVHFNAGRGSVMSILYLGGTIFIQEKFDEMTVLQTIERECITYTMMVPLLCERLLRHQELGKFKTSSLRYLGITGGHLSPKLALNIRENICPELYEAYASTDCGQITAIGPEDWAARGGISIFPEEIEGVLRRHPAVMDAAVIGFKSAEWGEAAKAFVVLNRGAQCGAEALIQFCKESLATYKAPKVVEFLSALPRTGLGKIDRGKLE